MEQYKINDQWKQTYVFGKNAYNCLHVVTYQKSVNGFDVAEKKNKIK